MDELMKLLSSFKIDKSNHQVVCSLANQIKFAGLWVGLAGGGEWGRGHQGK